MSEIVAYAIPIFTLLLCAEFAWGWHVRRNNYRLGDTLSSLSQGLLSQLVGLCTQFLTIGIYTLVQSRIALVHADAFWGSWAGIVLATIAYDFLDYWLHRAGHRSALFWAAHVVHHQSQHFNYSTALRQESFYPVLGFPFFLPMALCGVPPETFAIAGLVVLFYQFWIHTEHVGRLGWLDRVFSTPSNHRVHHAVNDGYVDRNYGAILIIWDRMFGTFAEERSPCVYGTRTPLESWDPLWTVAQVFTGILRDAWRTRRWIDKAGIWLRPPEWRPADLAARQPVAAFDLAAVRRYDPPVSRPAAVAAVLQFVAMALGAIALLWFADDLALGRVALCSAAIAAGLWVSGALLQGRIGPRAALLADAVLVASAAWALR